MKLKAGVFATDCPDRVLEPKRESTKNKSKTRCQQELQENKNQSTTRETSTESSVPKTKREINEIEMWLDNRNYVIIMILQRMRKKIIPLPSARLKQYLVMFKNVIIEWFDLETIGSRLEALQDHLASACSTVFSSQSSGVFTFREHSCRDRRDPECFS
jgi:hypothetical protein